MAQAITPASLYTVSGVEKPKEYTYSAA